MGTRSVNWGAPVVTGEQTEVEVGSKPPNATFGLQISTGFSTGECPALRAEVDVTSRASLHPVVLPSATGPLMRGEIGTAVPDR